MALDTMNIPAVQAWLEDWAAKGWFLKAYGAHIARFAAGERKEGVRYRLQPVKRDEAAPDCDVQTAYEEMGWRYVCSTGPAVISSVNREFYIWRCDDPAAPELETDQSLRGEDYAYLLRRWRRDVLICLPALAVMFPLLVWIVWSNPREYLLSRYPSSVTLLLCVHMLAILYSVRRAVRLLRFARRLRSGEPVPQRAPWRRARREIWLFWGLYALVLLLMVGNLFRSGEGRVFLPVSKWEEPAPYVSLAALNPADTPAEEACALDYHSVWARSIWWVLERGPEADCETWYFSLRFPSMAKNLEQQYMRPYRNDREWAYRPQTVPPELDSVWYSSVNGMQRLLLRRDGQVILVHYWGRGAPLDHLDAYIALLDEFA